LVVALFPVLVGFVIFGSNITLRMIHVHTLADLLGLLQLEPLEENIFRGQSQFTPWRRVYGGQVLAQALVAAQETLPEGRTLHSMHAYFILPGEVHLPIVYQVERIRDGGSFTTRRVKAIQKGKDIFILSASFQREESGFEHQLPMPNVPSPENLRTDSELAEVFKDTLPNLYQQYQTERPIEFRPVERFDQLYRGHLPPIRHVWMKARGEVPEQAGLHSCLLAYASDYNLLTTALNPHWEEALRGKLMLASLDHGMWFHRGFRLDGWLLYALDSPSASNARGFTRGNIFDQAGRLVASVVQEGLVRYHSRG